MATLDPGNAGVAEGLREHRFELHGFPAAQRIEMAEELRQQPHAETVDEAARLVAGLVLIEAQIGVERRLADIETPAADAAGILHENNVERMTCASGLVGRG